MHAARLDVSPNGNVGIVSWARGGINAMEAAVEEVIEALMDGISLCHHHCMALRGRVANSSNSVDLKAEMQGGVMQINMLYGNLTVIGMQSLYGNLTVIGMQSLYGNLTVIGMQSP